MVEGIGDGLGKVILNLMLVAFILGGLIAAPVFYCTKQHYYRKGALDALSGKVSVKIDTLKTIKIIQHDLP